MAPEENEVEVVPEVEGSPIEFRGLAPKAEQEGMHVLLCSRPFPDQWLTVVVAHSSRGSQSRSFIFTWVLQSDCGR